MPDEKKPDETKPKVPRDDHGNPAPPPQGPSDENQPVRDTREEPAPRPGG
ncbi:MAG: hypothetical protein M3Y43_06270 [Pseudomonadota bacterium]|nr:hypothetical protein [Pseudomonadota bacterium]